MIARLNVVALDCADPAVLADFYAALTGWTGRDQYGENWIQLSSDRGATLAEISQVLRQKK